MENLKNSSARNPARNTTKKRRVLGFALLNGLITFIFLELKELSFVQEHFSIYKGVWLLTNFLVFFLGFRFCNKEPSDSEE